MRPTQNIQYIILFLSIIFTNSLVAQDIKELNAELNQIDSISYTKEWLEKSIELGQTYFEKRDYEQSLLIYKKALHLAEKKKLINFTNILSVNIGKLYYYLKKTDKTQTILMALNPDELQLNDRGNLYRFLGASYIYTGEYVKAYDAQMNALKVFEELKDTVLMAKIEYGIGNTFFQQEQHQLSLKHFRNAMSLHQSVNNDRGVMYVYSAIGSLYQRFDSLDLAINYNRKSYEIAEELNLNSDMTWALFNIGSIKMQKGAYKEAEAELLIALKQSIEYNSIDLESYVLSALANLYKLTNSYDKALVYMNKSLEQMNNNNDRSNLKNLYLNMADLYYQKRDIDNYQKYINEYIVLKDSLLNESTIEEITALTEGFENEKLNQENEIALLEKDKQIRDIIVVAVFVILILIGVLTYLQYKNQNERNKLLFDKNKEIMVRNEKLQKANIDLEQYAFIISHDLREPLRNISGFTSLLKRKIKKYKIEDESTNEYMDFIVNGTAQMSQLLLDLLDYSKIAMKKMELQQINTQVLVENLLDGIMISNTKCHVNYTSKLPNIVFDKSQLEEVFYQLIDNAIKFRHPERNLILTIDGQESEDEYQFSIADNGIGIEKDYFEKIFIIFKRLHNRSMKGSGVGLATCKKIIEMCDGRIMVVSEIDKGSTFTFTVPKKRIENF